MISISHYLVLGAILFCISVAGIFLNRKNVIILLMAIELMLLAVNMNFIAFSNIFSTGVVVDPLPHAVVILSICVGGCVAGVALALIIQAYRIHATLNSRRLNQLKY